MTTPDPLRAALLALDESLPTGAMLLGESEATE